MLRFTYLAALSASSKSLRLSLCPHSQTGPSAGLPAQKDNYPWVGFAARVTRGRQESEAAFADCSLCSPLASRGRV